MLGADRSRGILLNAKGELVVVNVAEVGEDKLVVHDETSDNIAWMLARLDWPSFPSPFGVLRSVQRPVYEKLMAEQLAIAKSSGKKALLKDLMTKGRSWTVDEDGQSKEC